jgi:hypothetical protein
MSKIRIGDTVAFRRNVITACESRGVAEFRGTVMDVAGDWLFLAEASGRQKVMPVANMCKVARNGVVLELV